MVVTMNFFSTSNSCEVSAMPRGKNLFYSSYPLLTTVVFRSKGLTNECSFTESGVNFVCSIVASMYFSFDMKK